jgi:hypothetical protein
MITQATRLQEPQDRPCTICTAVAPEAVLTVRT